ncbi:MAG: YraN family protein [Bacteroidales bacterium]|nr:YraN family protein [Bacteroidales bacterium]
MAIHNITGKEGEELARRYLEANDYLILETNWHIGHLEADIIAYKDNRIVFIEVKTRSSDIYGSPEEFVDYKKRQSYIKLANAYIIQKDRSEEARFDIISVLMKDGQPHINHIINAFTTVG